MWRTEGNQTCSEIADKLSSVYMSAYCSLNLVTAHLSLYGFLRIN